MRPLAARRSVDGTPYGPYNRNGSPTTFDAQEQADVISAVTRMGLSYAMFDVNVTTDLAIRQAARAYGWILVTQDASGGQAWLGGNAIGRPTEAQAYCGAQSVRGSVFTWASLDRPDDVDLFQLDWSVGSLVLEGTARDVSTAVLVVDVLQGTMVVGGLETTPNLAAGTYLLRVKSRGGYAELGAYEVRAHH